MLVRKNKKQPAFLIKENADCNKYDKVYFHLEFSIAIMIEKYKYENSRM